MRVEHNGKKISRSARTKSHKNKLKLKVGSARIVQLHPGQNGNRTASGVLNYT